MPEKSNQGKTQTDCSFKLEHNLEHVSGLWKRCQKERLFNFSLKSYRKVLLGLWTNDTSLERRISSNLKSLSLFLKLLNHNLWCRSWTPQWQSQEDRHQPRADNYRRRTLCCTYFCFCQTVKLLCMLLQLLPSMVIAIDGGPGKMI